MKYNQNLLKDTVMSILGKSINLCYDKAYLLYLYNEYISNLYIRGSFNDGSIKLKIDIIENYVLYLFSKENRTIEEESIINKASLFYNEIGKSNKNVLLNSMIFNNVSKLGKSFFKDYDVIMNNIQNFSKEIKDYYHKYMNDQLVNSVEKISLMEYLVGVINKDGFKNVLENVFNKILNSTTDLSISEKNFLVQYINYKKCERLNLPAARVYISKLDLFSGEDIKEQYNGISFGDTGVISLNEYFCLNDYSLKNGNYNVTNGIKLIQTIYHEIEHYNQNSLRTEGILNESSFFSIKNILFRIYLSQKDFDEYSTNYKYRETEREANIKGWKDTARLLEEYSKDLKLKEIEECYYLSRKTNMEKANAWQKKKGSNSLEKMTIETYNIKNLVEIVRNNPKVLNIFPQLLEFFDKDGNINKPFSFFEKYTDLELKKIGSTDKTLINEINAKQICYEEFINYLFINRSFDKLNFDNYYNYEAMITFFSLLGQMFINECKQIKNMCYTFDIKMLDDFKNMLAYRIERLRKYYIFIKNNKALISKLDNYNQEHLNIRHRLFIWYLDIDKLENELKSVDRHLDRLMRKNDLKDDIYERRI